MLWLKPTDNYTGRVVYTNGTHNAGMTLVQASSSDSASYKVTVQYQVNSRSWRTNTSYNQVNVFVQRKEIKIIKYIFRDVSFFTNFVDDVCYLNHIQNNIIMRDFLECFT